MAIKSFFLINPSLRFCFFGGMENKNAQLHHIYVSGISKCVGILSLLMSGSNLGHIQAISLGWQSGKETPWRTASAQHAPNDLLDLALIVSLLSKVSCAKCTDGCVFLSTRNKVGKHYCCCLDYNPSIEVSNLNIFFKKVLKWFLVYTVCPVQKWLHQVALG